MIEKVIKGIMAAVQEDLTPDQLQKLENVLVIQLHSTITRNCSIYDCNSCKFYVTSNLTI